MPEPHSIRKHLRPLTEQQKNKLQQLSVKSLDGWKEQAVREAYIAPIIELLGYEKGTHYDIKYSGEIKLSKGLAKSGSKSWTLPDYYYLVWKQGFWVMEAKSAEYSSSVQFPKPSEDDIGQAFSYALHPEINSPYLVVCNGWWICLFDLDTDTPTQPILEIEQKELPQKFDDLRKILAEDQITFHLKQKILKRIDQVLSADCYPNRVDEFIAAVKQVGDRAKAKVRENFRVSRDLEEKKSIKFTEEWLDSLSPVELATYPLEMARTVSEVKRISEIILSKLPKDGGDWLFLSKLCLEEARPVNMFYYIHSLYLLGKLADKRKGNSPWIPAAIRRTGQTEITFQQLFLWWAEFLLNHLKERPELRMTWLVEGLFARTTKRLLVYAPITRQTLMTRVDLQRHYIAEETLSLMLPSPARELLVAVDMAINIGIGKYFRDHYDSARRDWKQSLAKQKYLEYKTFEQKLEEATPDYFNVLKNLGSDWIEFSSIDYINKSFDQLGAGVCSVLTEFPDDLRLLSESSKTNIINLARLHVGGADQCCNILGTAFEPFAQAEKDAKLKQLFEIDD